MLRSVDIWFPGYLAARLRRPRNVPGVRHLMFCLADHYEPLGGGASLPDARETVADWVRRYRECFRDFRDADGRGPRHTLFYPAEEYDRQILDRLAALCAEGIAEVEIHLHHRRDTPQGLGEKLCAFRDRLRREHGLLGSDRAGKPRYGFVHGNWALCNSRPDGDWCGVNNELAVLAATGCYADFTFPSAPSATQPRTVNALYYARDAADAPRGHDRGRRVRAGKTKGGAGEGELMLVAGPLAPDWRRRRGGVLPRLENGALTAVNPPVASRVDLWVSQWIAVAGRPDWVFVKVHTHGARPQNARMLFGTHMQRMHEHLRRNYGDGASWQLHYVAARELYNIVRAAEDGCAGNPGAYRDYEIAAPHTT